ncbi:50S ribosomal protein L30P [mine drainage metagenome]|jgi:large subunit ribosomal protein L30|uniref:50S ribosomal protein L30P n=1 Tax=mine drainage metagenome TaxID=410659 RepID=T1AAK7_9ZZZZ
MEANSIDGKLIAAVRIRGTVNVSHDIAETLNRLNLKKVSNCVVIRVNSSYAGMLATAKDRIAYGEVDKDTLAKLLAKYAKDFDAQELLDNKRDVKELREKMPFRLHPPRHGYKSTKLSHSQGGSLGYLGTGINDLIKRMV